MSRGSLAPPLTLPRNGGLPFHPKGVFVARQRPITSNDIPSVPRNGVRRSASGALSRSEIHALSRCAPLTKTEFKAQRELADQGVYPPVARLGDPPTHKGA